jgi:acetate---CoA ligase (ADP-forming)
MPSSKNENKKSAPNDGNAETRSVSTGSNRFGDLTPLLAPRSVAIVGASDRAGNLGGVSVGFLRKFGFAGPIWPVNPGRTEVQGLPCFPSLQDLPDVPDLVIVGVPAASVPDVAKDCIEAGVPAAVAWAGGFAETGEDGLVLQKRLQDVCRGSNLKFCGPNCIGVINTSMGLTASFGSMMNELDHLKTGTVSMVSQSGGIATLAHARAEQAGFGFRVTVSCGNEAVLSIADFIRALAHDDGTRVIAVYTEGVSNAPAFVEALAEARKRNKPVVILKGGASPTAQKAALAHTGRLAGVDRTYDAIFREFAAIRVHSMEEMLDVCLLLASLKPGQLPQGNRVLLTTFGGGAGVMATDQSVREGLVVPPLDEDTKRKAKPLLPAFASVANPVDMTPQAINNAELRSKLPDALKILADDPNIDAFIFLSASMSHHAALLVNLIKELREYTPKPVSLSWLFAPASLINELAAGGIYAFPEHARAVRAVAHLARRVDDMGHRIRRLPGNPTPFPWNDFVEPAGESRVISEHIVARILEAADLPVARGRLATSTEEAVEAAGEVGFPVVVKGISSALTHRASAGFVALNVGSAASVAEIDRRFRKLAEERGIQLDGNWVQHMVADGRELLVTAFRDPDFGIMVGCGMGGNQTEIIDDVVFTRAPIDADGALDLLSRLRTIRRLPETLSDEQRAQAARFIAAFSTLAAAAPWRGFTLEINPLKLTPDGSAAVDGLLIIDDATPAIEDPTPAS